MNNQNLPNQIRKILMERLDQFDVPVEVRNTVVQEILMVMGRPEQRSGATVMTPESSHAESLQRQAKLDARDESLKPKTM